MHALEQRIEPPIAVFSDKSVAVDPGSQAFERRGIQVNWPALSVARAGNQAGLLEHLDVPGDGLLGDCEGLGKLVDGGVAA